AAHRRRTRARRPRSRPGSSPERLLSRFAPLEHCDRLVSRGVQQLASTIEVAADEARPVRIRTDGDGHAAVATRGQEPRMRIELAYGFPQSGGRDLDGDP